MNNPYEVLGVSPNATDDEVRTAYRELVKKYHPDKYQNNPLADLAKEKLQEVNEAYDQINKERAGRGTSYGGSTANTGGYTQGKSYQANADQYNQVRRYIDMGQLEQATAVLNRISDQDSAEWMFLSGMISYRKGWYDDAMGKIQVACNKEPNNVEYRQALNALMNGGGNYRNAAYGRGYRSNEDLMCQACQCYLCADCCCDCF